MSRQWCLSNVHTWIICTGRSDTAGKVGKIAEMERHHCGAPCRWYPLTSQCLFSQVCHCGKAHHVAYSTGPPSNSIPFCQDRIHIYRCFLQAVSSISAEGGNRPYVKGKWYLVQVVWGQVDVILRGKLLHFFQFNLFKKGLLCFK